MSRFPDQPMHVDADGVVRFIKNRAVCELYERSLAAGYGLHELAKDAARGNYTKDELSQLAQLLGYSVSGFGDLSYADPEDVARLDEQAAEVYEAYERSREEQ